LQYCAKQQPLAAGPARARPGSSGACQERWHDERHADKPGTRDDPRGRIIAATWITERF